jgi:hypothetical protein
MRYKSSFWLVTALVAVFISGMIKTAYPYGFSKDQQNTVNLQTFVVSDFGDNVDKSKQIIWKANFSRFATPSDPKQLNSPPNPKFCLAQYMKGKPLGLPMEVDTNQIYCLGIKATFIKQSYNWIEVVPYRAEGSLPADKNSAPDSTKNPNEKVTNITLPGVIKSLDMWVWGGNYHYWLEFYLKDYKGFTYRLNAGDIGYVGWRNLRTPIPGYIPQAEYHVPFLKSLTLEMIKLWAYPTERIDQFFAYFDYLQVQTDVYIERFNGDDLANTKW